MGVLIHTLHVLLAGVWLGGVVFTTGVVSPALKAMKWGEPERISVRSVIGRYYARVAGVNLVLLSLFAVLDGVFGGFGIALYLEYAFLPLLFGLVASHGAYFGRRLRELAEAEREAPDAETAKAFASKRRSLGKLSFQVSLLTMLVSGAISALAANA